MSIVIDVDPEGALASTPVIDHEHPLVRETTQRLVGERSTPAERVAVLFEWVRDRASSIHPTLAAVMAESGVGPLSGGRGASAA